MADERLVAHAGGCHCGRVRFEVDAPAEIDVFECNCSKSFYVPRSHPNGISVNARCLDVGSVRVMRVAPFDGAHWEQARAALDSSQ